MKLSTQCFAFGGLALVTAVSAAPPHPQKETPASTKVKAKPAAPKPATVSGSPRQRLNFNANWRFQKGEVGGGNPLGQGYALQQWRWKSGNDLAALTENTAGAEWKDAASTDDVFSGRLGFAWFRTTLAPRSV